MPAVFLQGLREICDKNNLLLIVEVQNRIGRTARMSDIEHSWVRPDLLIMAKVGPYFVAVSPVGDVMSEL